jgi:PAS domain-containing protein
MQCTIQYFAITPVLPCGARAPHDTASPLPYLSRGRRSVFPWPAAAEGGRDAEDAIIGYLLIGTDNSARKQVKEEQAQLDQSLRDRQFYTRSLIESNIDALMSTDPRGIISDVNHQMEAPTGCTRDQLIGAPFKSYFTDQKRASSATSPSRSR